MVSQQPVCVVISTGGTIASRYDALGVARPEVGSAELVQAARGLEQFAWIETVDCACVPSPHVGAEEWLQLHTAVSNAVSRPDVTGVVITHGTAVLEETAWFLDLTLCTDKPVVLTGAQRNASEPDTDGPRNVRDAVRVAVSPNARQRGVLVVFNQRIIAAREVTKTHSFNVETFQSGERGFMGHTPPEGVTFYRDGGQRLHLPLRGRDLPAVEIVPMYAGASDRLLRAAAQWAEGIVVQAVGAGHVNPAIYGAVADIIGAGTVVVVSTRIPQGGTRAGYGFIGSSRQLEQAGAILSGALDAWKSRILLALALQNDADPKAVRQVFKEGSSCTSNHMEAHYDQ